MVFSQSNENLLVAMLLLKIILPCRDKNLNLWRLLGQNFEDLEREKQRKLILEMFLQHVTVWEPF